MVTQVVTPPANNPVRRQAVLVLAALTGLALWLLVDARSAHASRFGPPWQSEVTASQTVVYTQPDQASAPVGPLPRGAIIIVVDQQPGWVKIHHGWIPAADVAEKDDPWIAEVAAPSVSVYAKPNARESIRRTAREGDLLRVTGVAAGLDGDPNIWWATTEGYVALGSLRPATSDWAKQWTMPDAAEALNGWWGQVRGPANVRVGATTDAPVVGEFAGGERVKVLAAVDGQNVAGSATWYRVDGGRFAGAHVHSSLIRRVDDPRPNTTAAEGVSGTWITIDRSTNTLTLVKDGQAAFTTYVALGKAGRESPAGRHATFGKYVADRMTSRSVPDAQASYDLPNVPYTQYYLDGGYAIHGTYWHDQFASAESQGCVNLTWADAAYLFAHTQPRLADGTNVRWMVPEQATQVLILN